MLSAFVSAERARHCADAQLVWVARSRAVTQLPVLPTASGASLAGQRSAGETDERLLSGRAIRVH